MSAPIADYRRRVDSDEIARDAAQEFAVAALQRAHDELIAAGAPPRGWRRRLCRLTGQMPRPSRGVYLWGSVGRGKTFLMDLFYDCLPFEDKLRQHFHRFMGSVHHSLRQLRRHENPLHLAADRLAERTRVICFDEFLVTDIADAMILGNLFSALFERGVTLVTTSNVAPEELYRDGLQRQRFLPAVALIREYTEVVQVDGALDYRLRVLERADVYQHPLGESADQRLAEFFEAIAPNEGERDVSIEVLGRRIESRRSADGVVWFDFTHICDGPRSQDDYIELSRCYQTVVVSNVPQLTVRMENQARRFVALVDEFYDRRVKLVLSAEVPLASLYAGQRLGLEFRRTTSRLEEMQSHDYLAAPHLP